MKFALNLAEDLRVLSATYPQYAPDTAILVDEIPEDDISEYKYINGEFIYEPKPKVITFDAPTRMDRLEAQMTYTAMMTDTLLEVTDNV